MVVGPRLDLAATRANSLSFGEPLHHYQRRESTQAVARQLADDGAPEGTVVIADEQTAGRGRLGNSFSSPPGGLYLSLVLRPSLPASQAPVVGLALGLAVAESVQALTGLEAVLKWPNDVLIGGRKLSGVLIDLATSGERVRWAIAGVGVNVNVASFSGELRTTATSLFRELGHEIGIDALRAELLARFEGHYVELLANGPRPLIERWAAAPNCLGRIVRISAGRPEPCLPRERALEGFEGVAEGLDRDGALLVRLRDGQLRRVIAAEVHLLPLSWPD
ncbi:MAG TPA: biotin--[acetyl-CoA-carboxylase] ligase [Chloroflexota bacterium]|nr:biotin--[acetyl-CoA-carboxylase] ligase [Chloroflexota bacterium]